MQVHGVENIHGYVTFVSVNGTSVAVPVGPGNYRREAGDLVVARTVNLFMGLYMELAVRVDGTVWFAGCKKSTGSNLYWHRSRVIDDSLPQLTEEQRRTLALWYLGLEVPFGLRGLGVTVCRVLFQEGFGPQDVSLVYGDGSAVVLAGNGVPTD